MSFTGKKNTGDDDLNDYENFSLISTENRSIPSKKFISTIKLNQDNRLVVNHFNSSDIKRSKSTNFPSQTKQSKTAGNYQSQDESALNKGSNEAYFMNSKQNNLLSSKNSNQVQFKFPFGVKENTTNVLVAKTNIKPTLNPVQNKGMSNKLDSSEYKYDKRNFYAKGRTSDEPMKLNSTDSAREQTHTLNRLIKMAGNWNSRSRASSIHSDYNPFSATSSNYSTPASYKMERSSGQSQAYKLDSDLFFKNSTNFYKFNDFIENSINTDLDFKLSLTKIQLNYGFNNNHGYTVKSTSDNNRESEMSKEMNPKHRRVLASSQNEGMGSRTNQSTNHLMIKAQ